jgi:hypothetical protein
MGVFIDGVALELSGSLLPLSNKMKIYKSLAENPRLLSLGMNACLERGNR